MGKLKQHEEVRKWEVNSQVGVDELETAEAINNSLLKLFRRESEFDVPTGSGPIDIEFTVQEITKEMENLDMRVSQDPNGVTKWVLKEVRNRLADKIHGYKRSLTGVVPLVLGSADIVHIYKSRKKR